MNLNTTLAEMKTSLDTIYGTSTEVYDFIPESIIHAPAIILAITGGDYLQTLGSELEATVDVVVLLNRATQIDRNENMAAFSALIDASNTASVPYLVNNGTYTQDVAVQTQGFERGSLEIGGTVYDAVTFTVLVFD